MCICYGSLWCTWKARNDAIFNSKRVSPMKIAENVVTMLFSFMKHRSKFQNCTWDNWVSCPFNIIQWSLTLLTDIERWQKGVASTHGGLESNGGDKQGIESKGGDKHTLETNQQTVRIINMNYTVNM
ncbi:hypothetical protein LXL04_002370 [Taraxacum kok-saghyz]